jgi:AcrR family transcriptional regulator
VNAAVRQLSTAAERREALVEAAVGCFAEHGFHGTPTTEIAKAAGISQAYLFRLFPTKAELYVAAVERCYARLGETMRTAAEAARERGESALEAMGQAYGALLEDRTTLQATLQAFAAASGEDPAIRDAVQRGFGDLYVLSRRLGGTEADPERLRAFFAKGMLMTVLAGMDASSLDAVWARELLGETPPCEEPS